MRGRHCFPLDLFHPSQHIKMLRASHAGVVLNDIGPPVLRPVRDFDGAELYAEFGVAKGAVAPHVDELPGFDFSDLPALSVPASMGSVVTSFRVPDTAMEAHVNAEFEPEARFANFGLPWQLDGVSNPVISGGLSVTPGVASLFSRLETLGTESAPRIAELPGLLHGISVPMVSGGFSLGIEATSLFSGPEGGALGAELLIQQRADALDTGIAPWVNELPGLLNSGSMPVVSGGLSVGLGTTSLFSGLDADALGAGLLDRRRADAVKGITLWNRELPGLDGVSTPMVSGALSVGLGAASLFSRLDADALGVELDVGELALDADAGLLGFDDGNELWDKELPGLEGVSTPVADRKSVV